MLSKYVNNGLSHLVKFEHFIILYDIEIFKFNIFWDNFSYDYKIFFIK